MHTRSSEGVIPKTANLAGLFGQLMEWAQRAFRERIAGFGKARCEPRLKLVETLQLGGKRQLMLVQCDGQLVLVGAGGDSVQSITEIQQRPLPSPVYSHTDAALPELAPVAPSFRSSEQAECA